MTILEINGIESEIQSLTNQINAHIMHLNRNAAECKPEHYDHLGTLMLNTHQMSRRANALRDCVEQLMKGIRSRQADIKIPLPAMNSAQSAAFQRLLERQGTPIEVTKGIVCEPEVVVVKFNNIVILIEENGYAHS